MFISRKMPFGVIFSHVRWLSRHVFVFLYISILLRLQKRRFLYRFLKRAHRFISTIRGKRRFGKLYKASGSLRKKGYFKTYITPDRFRFSRRLKFRFKKKGLKKVKKKKFKKFKKFEKPLHLLMFRKIEKLRPKRIISFVKKFKVLQSKEQIARKNFFLRLESLKKRGKMRRSVFSQKGNLAYPRFKKKTSDMDTRFKKKTSDMDTRFKKKTSDTFFNLRAGGKGVRFFSTTFKNKKKYKNEQKIKFLKGLSKVIKMKKSRRKLKFVKSLKKKKVVFLRRKPDVVLSTKKVPKVRDLLAIKKKKSRRKFFKLIFRKLTFGRTFHINRRRRLKKELLKRILIYFFKRYFLYRRFTKMASVLYKRRFISRIIRKKGMWGPFLKQRSLKGYFSKSLASFRYVYFRLLQRLKLKFTENVPLKVLSFILFNTFTIFWYKKV